MKRQAGFRICKVCGEQKPLDGHTFAIKNRSAGTYSEPCRDCVRRMQRERRKARRVEVAAVPLAVAIRELPRGASSTNGRRCWDADAQFEYAVSALDAGACVYCGRPGTTLDHVTPVSFVAPALAAGVRFSDGSLWKVPACPECNSMAGSMVFRSFDTKRSWLHDAIRRKYAKELRVPDWTEEELAELGGKTRREVRVAGRIAELTRQRLNWDSPVVRVETVYALAQGDRGAVVQALSEGWSR